MVPAFAGPGRTTYQAKIVKPNGYPLESSSVSFQFTILDPLGSCILYSESYNAINMSSTGGLVSFSLGTGLKSFPLNATTFEQVFSNSTPSLLCAAGGPASYSPLSTDTRKVVMQFNAGDGWQTLPAMNINAVPYAMYANDSLKLEGLGASEFIRVSTLPTCTSSQALHFNGGGFSCVAVSSGSTGPVSYTVTSSDVTTALGFVPTPAGSYTAVTSTVTNLSTSVTAIASAVSNLGSFAYANFLDLGSASATGIVSDARLANQAGVISGTQYSKVTVDGKGRVISGSQITASEINSTLAVPSCGVNQYLTFNGTSYSCAADSGASGTMTSITTTGALSATAGSNPVLSLNYASDFTLASNALALMTTGVAPGTYVKMTVDAKGRVVSSSALTISDITTALGYAPVSASAFSSYVVRSSNLSDLTDSAAARNNLGLGGFATISSLDLSSASATGIISDARLANQSGVTSGAMYTKIYVDGKGRVVSGSTLSFSDVTAALGYAPSQSGSVVSSQWISSGSVISYSGGAVGIGTANPFTDLEVKSSVAGLTLTRTINSAASPDIYLRKDRGSGVAVVPGDTIGHIGFLGLTGGTSYTRGARISSYVTSAPAQGYISADLRFYTNDAGLDATERLRITQSGTVGIGTSFPAAELDVSGTIRTNQICDRNGNNCHVISGGWATGSSSATGSVSVTATAPLQVTGASSTPQLSLMTSGSVSGQTLRFDGTSWQRTKLLYTDLVNSTAASPWPVSSCGAGQAITWSSATDSFVCTSIQISAAQLPQANLASSASGGVTGILPVANGGTGLSAVGLSGTILTSQGAGQPLIWSSLASLTSGANNSMVSNWPDAIFCNNGTDYSVLYLDTRESSMNRVWYSKTSGGAGHFMHFNMSSGAYVSHTAFTGNSVCASKSISTLVSEGRYFNFAKGPVGVWLQNGNDAYYNAGSVIVGAGSATVSAQFEVSSTTKGFLPPRLSTIQRDAIASPANGLMIYNSTALKYQFYDGTAWTDLGSGVAGSSSGTGTISSRQYFTSNGTFTVPAGITRIRVSVAGGGGGGGDYTSTNGADAGSSSFGGTVIGAGGLGGARGDYGLDRNGNLHGGGSGGNITIIGGGAAGGPGRPTWQSNSDPIDATGQTGGNGGLTISDMNVTPGASFAVVIGGGGAATGGSPGANGYVIVEWGGGGGSGVTTIDLGSASATGTLAAARLPAFSGDLSSSAGSSTLILSNTGVTPGTYDRVTVDAKGRVTSGSMMSALDITNALGYTPTNVVSGTLGGAIAWVSYNSAGVIQSSFNILSVSKTATGRFVVNFRYNLPDSTYAVITGGINTGASDGSWASVDNTGGGTGKSVSGVRIISYNSTGSVQDYPETYIAVYHGSGTSPLAYGFSESGNNIYRTSGNIGIGTSNPTRLLHIAGSAPSPTPGMAIEHLGTGGRNYGLLSTGANNNQGDGKFLFYDLTSSTTRMAIDSLGYVGIGTASPTAHLDVSGTIRADRICDRSGNNCQTISSGWTGSTSGSGTTWQLVSRQVVTAASASAITFTGLNGDVDQTYKAVIKIKHNLPTGTSGVFARINGDSAGNYQFANIYGTTGGPYGSTATAQTGLVVHGGGAAQNSISIGEMLFNAETGNQRSSVSTMNQGGGFVSILWSSTWANTTSNVTSISFEGAVANVFASGTAIELWTKRTNTSAGGGWTDDGTNIFTTNLTRNIGIGESNPSRKLAVNDSTGNTFASIKSSDTGVAGLLLGDQSSDARGQIRYDNNNDSMAVYTAGGERIRVTSGGAVGIGTTTPAYGLDVRSTTFAAGGLAQAYINANFSVAAGSGWIKVTYNAVEFDTDSAFNLTNNRFIPNKAGYYRITMNSHWAMTGTTGFTLNQALYKNGSQIKVTAQLIDYTAPFSQTLATTAIVYLNGSSDYVEGYVTHNSGNSAILTGGSAATWISTEFIRSP